jgi:hypothetical protein
MAKVVKAALVKTTRALAVQDRTLVVQGRTLVVQGRTSAVRAQQLPVEAYPRAASFRTAVVRLRSVVQQAAEHPRAVPACAVRSSTLAG